MTTITALRQQALLPLALKLDALVTGANGAAYVAAASVLDEPLGIPESTRRSVGVFLLLFAMAVWSVATRPEISRTAVLAVVAANALWVIDSLLAVAFDWGSPTTAGAVWIVLQALVVLGFAALQSYALSSGSPSSPSSS